MRKGQRRLPKLSHASSQYGAQMGRGSYQEYPEGSTVKAKLWREPFVDGDYDRGGAYWGGGMYSQPIFMAMDKDNQFFTTVRASNIKEAEETIREDYPDVTFDFDVLNS